MASLAAQRRVSFCDSAKKHDGMSPVTEHYDEFMRKAVEQNHRYTVNSALAFVPQEHQDAVKALALDFCSRYNKLWRENPSGVKGTVVKTVRARNWQGWETKTVQERFGCAILSTGGGIGLKIQTAPGHLSFVANIREWGRIVKIQRAWKKYKARKIEAMEAELLRRKHENHRRRREQETDCFDVIQAIKSMRGIPEDQRCLKFPGPAGPAPLHTSDWTTTLLLSLTKG